jgi:phosphinothricin acetyltransferase
MMNPMSSNQATPPPPGRIRVRGTPPIVPLVADHWKAVRTILLEGIATGNTTFDRKAPEWVEWDSGHLPRCRLVALHETNVIGWAAIAPVSPRPVYAGVGEVEIVVASAARAQGVGRALLHRIIDASEAAGVWMLQSSLFPENEAGIKLLTSAGFREVGRRERIGKHFSRWRDIVLLERRSRRVGIPPPPTRR